MTALFDNAASGSPQAWMRPASKQRRSRDQKLAIVRECLSPGQTIAMVAYRHSMSPNTLLHWIRLYAAGSWRMGMSSVNIRTS
jgi:transposase-like protein